MEQFYLQHIAQSEYRKIKGEIKNDSKINVELSKLDLVGQQEVKNQLKQRIKDEGLRITKALFLEEKWPLISEGACFTDLYSKLGL